MPRAPIGRRRRTRYAAALATSRPLHGAVHPQRPRIILRRLAVRAARGGREGAGAPRRGREQRLNRDVVHGRVHADAAQEPRRRAGVQGGGAREVRQLRTAVAAMPTGPVHREVMLELQEATSARKVSRARGERRGRGGCAAGQRPGVDGK